MLIMLLDWTSYQIMILMTGYLSVDDQAANIILQSLTSILFQIPFGFQMSACALVGKDVGENEPIKAKKTFKFIFVLSMFINCL